MPVGRAARSSYHFWAVRQPLQMLYALHFLISRRAYFIYNAEWPNARRLSLRHAEYRAFSPHARTVLSHYLPFSAPACAARRHLGYMRTWKIGHALSAHADYMRAIYHSATRSMLIVRRSVTRYDYAG